MGTVFLSILNQMEIHLVQNRKQNCHHDQIQFNLKGNRILVFSVHASRGSYDPRENVVQYHAWLKCDSCMGHAALGNEGRERESCESWGHMCRKGC